jgi:hypothetical protein
MISRLELIPGRGLVRAAVLAALFLAAGAVVAIFVTIVKMAKG